MTKTNPRLSHYFVPLVLAVMLAFLFKACKKTDFSKEEITEPVSKFFTVPSNTPSPVLKVVDALKKQNDIGGFIPSLAKNDGYAVWNKSVIELSPSTSVYNRDGDTESVDTLVFTPIVQQDSNFVNGFFFSRIVGDSVELHLYRANDYDLYPYRSIDSTVVTAELIALKIAELEFNIYGEREYRLLDDSLFLDVNGHHGSDSIIRILRLKFGIDPGARAAFVGVQICVLGSSGSCHCHGPCHWATGCDYCSNLYCDASSSPGLGAGSTFYWPPDPQFGFPSGGGGNNPPDNGDCTGIGDCRPSSLIAEGKVPCGGCGPGPMVVVPIEDPTDFNPYSADEVIIDTSITNNFPCVGRIIDSLTNFANINALSQVALNQVFGLNKKIQLTFKTEPSWGEHDNDGITDFSTAQQIGDTFVATIRLNPWVLRNSTEEFIAATIIHESIHSYIDFKFNQYILGVIDSTEFKSMFPLFWPKVYSSGMFNIGSAAQHQAMAANLITIMSQPLNSLYPNSQLTATFKDSLYQSLSWGGLENTTVYFERPDSIFIKAVNRISRDTSTHAPFIFVNTPLDTIKFDAHNLNMIYGCH